MIGNFNSDDGDREYQDVFDEKAVDLFKEKANTPQLQVKRIFKLEGPCTFEEKQFCGYVDLKSLSDIKAIKAEANDAAQIFVIRQERSWTTLNISRNLFEEFTEAFGVFKPFWKCVLTFGNKCEEHECEFPGFSSRRSPSFSEARTIESAYILHRAELNNRASEEGVSPWSIRQTAVYHGNTNLASNHGNKSTFLLISPSKAIDSELKNLSPLVSPQAHAFPSPSFHCMLVADSVKGWKGYIAWLEQDLKERSDRIIFSRLGSVEKDFGFDVTDRQALKLTEDAIIDLQIILSTLMSTIKGVCRNCERSCNLFCARKGNDCVCDVALEEFENHEKEIDLCLERTKSLRERAISSAQLLSDLLRYEDQRALKDLTIQSQTENQTMLSLAEKSAKDAEAVMVLTVIGLVYLPTTIVANIFSTEFVQTDDTGTMRLAANAWLLAAIALPLTFLTVITWWMFVRYKTIPIPQRVFRVWKGAFHGINGSLERLRRKPQPQDPENLEGSPMRFGRTRIGTWSTRAPTLKSESA